MVYDKETGSILFEVFDYDLSTQLSKGMKTDDLLGRASLNLDRIPMSKPTQLNMPLHDTKSGSLNIICEYCPLKINHGRFKNSKDKVEGKDIIFQFSPDAFLTDILDEEPAPLFLSSDDSDNDMSTGSGSGYDEHNNVCFNDLHGAIQKVNPFSSKRTGVKRPTSAPGHSQSTTSASRPSSSHATSVETEERIRRLSTGTTGVNWRNGIGGVLCVNQLRCRNIKKSSRRMRSSLRPYVVVSVDNQVKKTETKRNNQNPTYEETFNFFVTDANIGSVKFKIFNEFPMSKDVIIGQFSVDVSEVKSEGKLEKQWMLDGAGDSQMFACTLVWVAVAS